MYAPLQSNLAAVVTRRLQELPTKEVLAEARAAVLKVLEAELK